MEAVYLQKNKIPVNEISENTSLKLYFEEFSNNVKQICNVQHFVNLLNVEMDLSESEVRALNKTICWTKLRGKPGKVNQSKVILPVDGFRQDFILYDLPKSPKLKSNIYLKKRAEKDAVTLRNKIKYCGELDTEDLDIKKLTKNVELLEPLVNYVLTVRIYLPCMHPKVSTGRSKSVRVSQEFLLPSCLTLDHLRDRIGCHSDFQPMEGDVSKEPLSTSQYYAMDQYKSGMFYIGNVFYIDCRFAGNIDYSEPIRNWGKKRGFDLNFVEPMEMTKVDQLSFRLGYPYVYMHQGDCEHLIVFTDARLLSPMDKLIKTCYPLLKSFSNLRGSYCMTCGVRIARYIVVDTERLPSDYCYLCTVCLYLYNYIDDEKVEDFKVYKYIDRVALF
ncbi:snRNA-activating protein complex subunit 3 [Cimex lectularius]|uniref:snRNA-activating protein complex subunit 3 n=1 Tax=Cimex lectularius TaxID=79782 RepID=A0A8I6THE2_CIMLE|nr:snRNA-activating protein complex subunit 3 [Cimex lectularius]XP_014260357.1 snRNA-activating protein complex subunit 3 [Cimex lectularius]XP_014260358.1 snRNA-activating protein complex subunit 3 [Cimex lectularius]XP_014260359.1 snRNA-activating protein complex subunit 3 [Cimex lectularius]